jgi:periplasmic protein TonB
MPTTNVQVENQVGETVRTIPPLEHEMYRAPFVETPFWFISLVRQVWERWHAPKVVYSQHYYRGERPLPLVDMAAWYHDLPGLLRSLFEKPRAPSIPLTSTPVDVPDIWQDYDLQAGSWMNSVLIHTLAILAIILPFVVKEWLNPVKTAAKFDVVDISPYVASLPASAKKMGGGGGGGDRSPTPASKGAIPKFSHTQLAPPMAVLPNLHPIMPVQPTLLGPPELKLPQMAANMPWGDPSGALGPPSNGPGFGGGIGSGEGTGIGSGKGGGLGPGEGGGFGGGAYSVGGGVSAPIPIYKPEPAYSEEARKAKYQGTVVLWIVVDAQGGVAADVRVVKPLGLGLDEKAVEAVRTWKFKPAQKNGTPVPVRVMVEVSFRLF